MNTLKKEGRAFRNIGKNIYIPDCKISLASFVLYSLTSPYGHLYNTDTSL